MGTVMKTMLGVILGAIVLIGGCAAVLGAGVESANDEQKKQGITASQFQDIRQGTDEATVRSTLGEPEDAQQFEDAGVQGLTGPSSSSCIYYPEKGMGIGEGKSFQLCFDNARLTSKNVY